MQLIIRGTPLSLLNHTWICIQYGKHLNIGFQVANGNPAILKLTKGPAGHLQQLRNSTALIAWYVAFKVVLTFGSVDKIHERVGLLPFSVQQGTREVWSQNVAFKLPCCQGQLVPFHRKTVRIDHITSYNKAIHAVFLGNAASCPWQHGNLNAKTLWPNFSCALLNWRS